MAKITSRIIHIDYQIDVSKILGTEKPKYFTEIVGKKTAQSYPTVRYIDGQWLNPTAKGIKIILAKKGLQTVTINQTGVDILGTGNYESVLLALYRNGWVNKDITNKKVEYKSITGTFSFGKRMNLNTLVRELNEINIAAVYIPELFPAVKFKLGEYSYQVFGSGVVLFRGFKTPSELNKPIEKLKNLIINEHNTIANLNKKLTSFPFMEGKLPKINLAWRYPLAKSWNSKPPPGYYVRPGTNKVPRFYRHRQIYRNPESGEVINYGPINLKGVAPKVVKAFKNLNVPIPKATLNAFKTQMINLQKIKLPAQKENKRAPRWNATKPGYYVRPGPGHLPVWAEIPKSKAAGKKTVIKRYTEAGRNIPKAVREIFKINNKTAHVNGPRHSIEMGLNGHLRINGQQAKRFRIKNLVTIARNLKIPQVNTKTARNDILFFIKNKAGISSFPNKTFNVQIGDTKYKLLPDGKIEITKGKKRTTREWATFPNKNAVAQQFLGNNLYKEYTQLQAKNKYNSLLAIKKEEENLANNLEKAFK